MNAFKLMETLRVHIEKDLATYPFQEHKKTRLEKNEDGSLPSGEAFLKNASIYLGGLPCKSSMEAYELVPFVIIQALNGQDDEGEQIINLAFRLALKNREPEALEHDLHNFITVVRHSLFKLKENALEGKIILCESDKGILPWEIPDEQQAEYGQAYILGTFKVPSIQ